MTKLSLMLAVSALCVGLSFQDNHGGGPTTPTPTGSGMGGRMGGGMGGGMGGSRGMDGGYGMDRGMGQRRRKGDCGGGSKKDSMKETMMMMLMGGMGGGMGGGCGGGGCGGGGQGGGMNPMMVYMMMNQMKDMMGGDQDRDCDRDDRDDRDRRHEPERPQPRPRMHLPCRVQNSEGAAVSRECGMKHGQQMTCDIGPIEHESSGWSFTFCTIPCPREQDMVNMKDIMRRLGMTPREMMGMDDGDMPDREIPDGGPVNEDDRFYIELLKEFAKYVREECGMMMSTMMPTMAGGN